jgi:hypothetical protein
MYDNERLLTTSHLSVIITSYLYFIYIYFDVKSRYLCSGTLVPCNIRYLDYSMIIVIWLTQGHSGSRVWWEKQNLFSSLIPHSCFYLMFFNTVIYVTIDVRYWEITTSYLSVIITSYKTQSCQGSRVGESQTEPVMYTHLYYLMFFTSFMKKAFYFTVATC